MAFWKYFYIAQYYFFILFFLPSMCHRFQLKARISAMKREFTTIKNGHLLPPAVNFDQSNNTVVQKPAQSCLKEKNKATASFRNRFVLSFMLLNGLFRLRHNILDKDSSGGFRLQVFRLKHVYLYLLLKIIALFKIVTKTCAK